MNDYSLESALWNSITTYRKWRAETAKYTHHSILDPIVIAIANEVVNEQEPE